MACFPVLLTLAITWPLVALNEEGSHMVAAQVNGGVSSCQFDGMPTVN
jgi:hypothetical protein